MLYLIFFLSFIILQYSGIRLMRTNREVDDYNQKCIKDFDCENCYSEAEDTFKGEAKYVSLGENLK